MRRVLAEDGTYHRARRAGRGARIYVVSLPERRGAERLLHDCCNQRFTVAHVRSLEARWAAFFDRGWTHEYEPFDLGHGRLTSRSPIRSMR
jgi:hypothetical protein